MGLVRGNLEHLLGITADNDTTAFTVALSGSGWLAGL